MEIKVVKLFEGGEFNEEFLFGGNYCRRNESGDSKSGFSIYVKGLY